MAVEWAGVVNTTTTHYLKGAEDHTVRDRIFLAMAKKKGRLMFNQDGKDIQWQVEAIQPTVEAYGDAGNIDFSRSNVYRTLTLDWRGYKVTDLMTEKEKLMNRGNAALINRYARIMPNLTKALTDKFGEELYIDGNATGNDNRIHGLESFFGTGTTAAGDRIAEPSDTYGGKSTAVAQLDTTWDDTLSTQPNSTISTDWPEGKGSSGYDYLSPKIGNWSSTAWGTGSTAWEDNCERVIGQMDIWATLGGGKAGKVDVCLLAGDLYYGYLNKQRAKQRIVVSPTSPLRELGFDSVNQEGIEIATEFGIGATVGYGINFDEMTLRAMYGQLFMPRGPEYDIKSDAYLFMVGFFGNATFNPKAHWKIDNIA